MFEVLYKPVLQCVVIVVVGAALTACAAAKNVRSAADLKDDGKRNSLMLSYEIRLDAHDRYPDVQSTTLAMRCGPKGKINPFPVCFYLTIPFRGKRNDDGYVYNTFELSGTSVFQMKYGDYSLVRANHSVVVGKRRERVCHKVKTDKHKGHEHSSHDHDPFNHFPHNHTLHSHSGIDSYLYPRVRCHDRYTDITHDFLVTLPTGAPTFTVARGDGCYLGHLTLHMRANKIVNFEFDDALQSQKFEQLPEQMRETARDRIKQNCVNSATIDLRV